MPIGPRSRPLGLHLGCNGPTYPCTAVTVCLVLGTATRVLQHGGGLNSRWNLLGIGSSAGDLWARWAQPDPIETGVPCCHVRSTTSFGEVEPHVVVVLMASIQGTISLCLARLVAGASVRRRWGFVSGEARISHHWVHHTVEHYRCVQT
jgi:hypothetical protein